MGSTSDALELHVVPARGWRSGLGHMLRWEGARWWHTRQWWIQMLLWTSVINGYPSLSARLDNADEGVMFLIIFLGVFAAIGVLVMTQGTIIGEKQSGTAAWVLSKPLARSAFMLTKLGANALAILSIMIVLQGVVGYIQLSLADGAPLAVPPFVAALGLMSLYLLFYLTFTVMLGTLFRSRGPVLGIAFGLLIGGALAEDLIKLLPSGLVVVAQAVAHGHTLPAWWWLTILLVVAYAIAAVGVALWRFGREEL